jgi:acyl-CoA synthetase (AMP-forming)/AMP-acid ligase II
LAYFLKKIKVKRVGLLCPNTPAFLESVFGIGAAGAVNVGKSLEDFQTIEKVLNLELC